MVFGNFKGALSMAAVLALPATMPHRERLLTIVFGVTFVSLVSQALPFRRVLLALGVANASEDAFDGALGAQVTLATIDARHVGIDGIASAPAFEAAARETRRRSDASVVRTIRAGVWQLSRHVDEGHSARAPSRAIGIGDVVSAVGMADPGHAMFVTLVVDRPLPRLRRAQPLVGAHEDERRQPQPIGFRVHARRVALDHAALLQLADALQDGGRRHPHLPRDLRVGRAGVLLKDLHDPDVGVVDHSLFLL
jgi:hypothetical protein